MRILLFILSLLFCVSVDAQKLTVESFGENTRDLAARTEQRVDNNGVPCALVKVWLAASGAVFEGNVMGNVAYKTSEYWVYMPKGTKRLLVKLEGYLPLPVEFQPLESNVTYVLTVSGVGQNKTSEIVAMQEDNRAKGKIGSCLLADGAKYNGEISNKTANGKGEAVYKSGDVYQGDFVNGKRQGYGVYRFSVDGERYEGEWFADMQHGRGKCYFSDGDVYDGLWYKDFMQGKAVLQLHNGDVYDGNWLKDKKDGYGVYTWTNGDNYSGQWRNDIPNGNGKLTIRGIAYDGAWTDGKWNGPGKGPDCIMVSDDRLLVQRAVRNSKTSAQLAADAIAMPEKRVANDDDTVFDVVDKMPTFVGGTDAIKQYISTNLKYPPIAEENGIQGRVIVQFVVEKDGSLSNVGILRTVDPSLDKEAERIIRSMPRWNPGTQNGKPVRVRFNVPVIFRLQ